MLEGQASQSWRQLVYGETSLIVPEAQQTRPRRTSINFAFLRFNNLRVPSLSLLLIASFTTALLIVIHISHTHLPASRTPPFRLHIRTPFSSTALYPANQLRHLLRMTSLSRSSIACL
ncbi:hypothetical protein EJ06DRAFT_372246 [Trichodelitschia bisporula]|uniref:Uncharacterized protein n=1 Tax=Trichodelitschia bisporula TaxID=703511 RepID=A0A6G1I1A1_9PEZI|nr:hypothetical protein EJ06DRAFT_372246 [Trichodelitschia bisporula]